MFLDLGEDSSPAPVTRHPSPDTRNPKLETLNSELETFSGPFLASSNQNSLIRAISTILLVQKRTGGCILVPEGYRLELV